MEEINENPWILPNVTLGFAIYNSEFRSRWTYLASMELLSTNSRFIPNYKCDTQNNAVAVIGGPDSKTCLDMADILLTYKFPQLTYSSDLLLNNDKPDVFFHKLFPNISRQDIGILELLLYFEWVWIGVIFHDDENEKRFVENVLPLYTNKGICFEFLERCSPRAVSSDTGDVWAEWFILSKIVMGSTANVVVVNGEIRTMSNLRMLIQLPEFEGRPTRTKIWVMTAQMDFTSLPFQRSWDISFIHGAISFAIQSKEIQQFQEFVQLRNHLSQKADGFARDFWEQSFNCIFPGPDAEITAMKICTGEEKLETLPKFIFETSMSSHSYSMYNAVYAVAHALHDRHLSKRSYRRRAEGEESWRLNLKPWQIHYFLRRVSFNNSAGGKISFNENGELETGFDIINWITFPNQTILKVKIGSVDSQAFEDKTFSIHEDTIVWPRRFNQVRPLSLCNDHCPTGSSKRKRKEEPFCCYDCLPCPERKISEEMDMDDCSNCPEDKHPNAAHNECILKEVNFLSFDEPLGMSLALSAVSFAVLTVSVLGIFIRHHHTAIVKANNRNLTYTLLIVLSLSFLCALLFIGRPQTLLCLFRQPAFGILFSVAVSCILSKTITVILAFMATKPGSRMRKWVGNRFAISTVIVCSLIQTSLCMVWLAISPPFLDVDMLSMEEEIVLECNEGLTLMFYCVLGYMGFLAIASFNMAFLARKLPDSFNEAKFITFSMVVFCSVWISFVPTYLSTKGKYMVAVEIFSILTSCMGLLICIFSPKCYIILIRPELNIREQLMRRNEGSQLST